MTKHDYDLQLPEKLDFALMSGLKYNFIFTKSRNIEIYRVLSSTDHLTHNTGYFSTVYSGADQRKLQSSASLAFVRGIHR